MKRKTRSCSISMRPMHVSVFVCVCAYKWATSAAVVDIFTCAFYMGVFGYTLRRSTSTSPRLHLLSLLFIFPFAAASFHWSLTPQSQAASPACGSTSILSLVFVPPRLPRSSLSVCSFDTLRALLLHCFSHFFLHLVANFNCLETSCGPAEISISNSSAAVARTGPGRLLICPKPKLPCLSDGLAARLESSINY